jgi:hypothetical protein
MKSTFAYVETKKAWKVYDRNDHCQGFFLEHEKELAEAEAKRLGGYILPEEIHFFK